MVQVDDSTLRNEGNVFDTAMNGALEEWSRRIKRHITFDQPGNGTKIYDMPATWEDGISSVVRVEVLPDSTDVGVSFGIDQFKEPSQKYAMYENDQVTYQLVFLEKVVPVPSNIVNNLRIIFVGLHDLSSIRKAHNTAFSYLMSAHVCEVIQAQLTNDEDSTLAADTVDNQQVAEEWQDKAKDFRILMERILKPKSGDAVDGATVYVDMDSLFAGERRRIVHNDARWGGFR